MRKYFILTLLGSAFLLLAACQQMLTKPEFLKDPTGVYLEAEEGKSLDISKKHQHKIKDNYILPKSVSAPEKTALLEIPPDSLTSMAKSQGHDPEKIADRVLESAVLKPERALDSKIVTRGRQVSFLLQQELNEAWPQVEVALNRAHFRITNSNRELGVYYVLDTRMDARVTRTTPIYAFYLKPQGSHTLIVVRDEHNKPLPSALANNTLLSLLQGLRGVESMGPTPIKTAKNDNVLTKIWRTINS